MKANLQLIVAICFMASWCAYGEKTQAEKEALKKKLTEIQYRVTQEDGTERPFKNEYWNNKAAGIYVDIVSGEALFSSLDKFKSGTGWPSFTKPIKKGIITYKEDKSLFYTRTEVRSTKADSHLGHVFDDGPKPTGKRYCINSAALRFIPAANLAKEGYGEYAKAFPSDSSQAKKTKFAIFAGGCFWCTEADFEKLPGVLSAESGYIDGHTKKPTYKDVSRGITGHTEAVKVTYDPKLTNYTTLLDHFWPSIDPTVKNRQFCDTGSQYRSGIYYLNNDQKKAALASLKKVDQRLGRTIYTEIKQASTFYPAEDYHQDYYRENPTRYKIYRYRCGRDARLKEIWGERAGKHLGLN